MRFLLHGKLNPSVKTAVERHGHVAFTYAEADIGTDVVGGDLLQVANQKQLDIITADKDLAAVARESSLKFTRSLVYLQLEGDDVEQDDAVDRLFARYKSPKPHQMYTVTESRVKVQQLKTA